MTPYMAQGAASALEDAAILSRVLTGVEVDGLGAAFKLYEAIRKPRASAIQAGSSANTWLKGKTDPSWVYGYDSTTVPLQEPAAA
jgi:salicylate hydroxylase/6-hydroxynicotinate 3-monooxygenase